MCYIVQGNVTKHLHVHFIPRYKEPRIFDNIKFVDEHWGKNYSPYNKDFKIPESTMLKLCEEIKKVI